MARHKAIDGVFEFEASAIDGDDGVYIERSFVGRESSFDGFTVPKELILDVADDIRSEENEVQPNYGTLGGT